MGVFKWLRRERVTVTTHHSGSPGAATPEEHSQSATQVGAVGTIRTEKYKRDLAEFQARRSAGAKELEITPVKKKCGRHSLPVSCSCTDFQSDHDNTFNYEKKSVAKYKKHKRARSNTPEKLYEGVPNIQFLFQNQVFMPGGNMFTSSYSEPQKLKRQSRRSSRSPDLVQKHIDFKDNDVIEPPPEFIRENSLRFELNIPDVEQSRSEEEVDGFKAAGDVMSSHSKDGDEKLWEVMSELKHLDQWADEQLMSNSPNASRSDDSRSESSAYGLPIASSRHLDISADRQKIWNNGQWGVVPVQIKKLSGVSVEHVRKKRNIEINILRKCRHPNIILLMGLYPDANSNVHIICERCVDSLFGILHVQGRILTAQMSIQYALDIANALVFLSMQGYIHTELNSMAIMITSHDTAKLADLGPCVKVHKADKRTKGINKDYEVYSPEPQYVNIEGTRESKSSDNEPLLSAHSSETYLKENAVAKPYESFQNSELYRWQAPELFDPTEEGLVHPCSKSDVYSLCLILWECCNGLRGQMQAYNASHLMESDDAAEDEACLPRIYLFTLDLKTPKLYRSGNKDAASLPWKLLTYEKLKEHYTLWNAGVPLPQDGTYPGCLLSLLQSGLRLDRGTRATLASIQLTLHNVKTDLASLDYIIIPARLHAKPSNFSSVAWASPGSSASPARQASDTPSDSDRDPSDKSDAVYETINKTYSSAAVAETCFIPDEPLQYNLLPERECSSACSTPLAKVRARIKDVDTTALHRSDSTEYCSILSPNRTNFASYDDSYKDQSSPAKFSRSFTPKSYKPLHIKVPEFNLDSIKPLLKDRNGSERPSYNFDIKNYSLPSTPIARSNKLRKNAWLSGDVPSERQEKKRVEFGGRRESVEKTPSNKDCVNKERLPESPDTLPKSTSCSPEVNTVSSDNNAASQECSVEPSPAGLHTERDVTGLRRPGPIPRVPWQFPAAGIERARDPKIESELLANMQVKPLVAIHERWIYEANRKARAMSLPEETTLRSQTSAVKPASHCVDTLQKSLPQLNVKKQMKTFRMATSPNSHGGNFEQFCQARETIARGINFAARSPDRAQTWRKDCDKGTTPEYASEPKIDQCTDTKGIEDFIRDLIRTEFQHLVYEMDNTAHRNEELLNKGVSHIVDSLNNDEDLKRDPVKSFSRVKINGNNKPLLQITFNRSGENSLQVLDGCVNVTICDGAGAGARDKLNVSADDTLTEDPQGGLKRCQAFNAIQEARSTEDLYIDDDLSTHMQENFGGRVKLIPLHGSLHEILCEREDDCCLIKVRQENGCDAIYFRCDNSDTESRDAVDGDTVVYKRSIAVVEERIQRRPRAKAKPKPRPKSDTFPPLRKDSRVLSASTPALNEPELNIEHIQCYQDSSSDECVQDCDEFEMLEKTIDEDIKAGFGLGKISEENLSLEDADKYD